MATIKCPSCGAEMPDYSRFCTECGNALAPAAPAEAEVQAEAEVSEPAPAAAVSAPQMWPPTPAYAPTATAAPASVPPTEAAQSYSAPQPAPRANKDGAPFSSVAGTKYEPVTTAGFVGISFLMMIPVVNLVFLIVWACGGCRKVNKRNWARSVFVMALIGVIFTALSATGLMIWLKSIGLDFHALSTYDYGSLIEGLNDLIASVR